MLPILPQQTFRVGDRFSNVLCVVSHSSDHAVIDVTRDFTFQLYMRGPLFVFSLTHSVVPGVGLRLMIHYCCYFADAT